MNPVLNKKTFQTVSYGDDVMTTNGVINKSFILWLILAAGAYLGWTNATVIMNYIWLIIIGVFALCLLIVFNLRTAPYFSPIYAFGEGLMLGAITLFFEKDYPGIAVNAIFLTICDLFLMLAAFKSGKIRATKKFQKVVILSTFAIFLVYFLDIILSLCHVQGISFIHSSGAIGILISVFVVIIASLCCLPLSCTLFWCLLILSLLEVRFISQIKKSKCHTNRKRVDTRRDRERQHRAR